MTFNQVHLELLHNLYQWREKIHFRQFISLWKYALDIYPGTLWRDLLWPSLTFDQYHCTFLYTSNFQWMKYKPDETMGRGNMLWTGIYREMWFDLLFFYLNKGYCTSIIHSNGIWKKLNPDWVREHKIYSEHVILILERLIAISHLQTRAILSWGPCMGLSSLPNIMLPYKDNNTHVNRDQP